MTDAMIPILDKPPLWMVSELRRRTGLPIRKCRQMLETATLAEYKEITGQHDGFFKMDPGENNPDLAAVLLRASLETDAELAKEKDDQMGFCHLYWHTKKRILRERYGMEWQTPSEISPQIVID
jgi:hypothetical protein